MKKLLFLLFIVSGFISKAQVYNNEWIDYSKTYYKFKVEKTGLHRIPQALLASAGLGNTPAEYFQLWRNGVQVPIYTSVATGPLSSSDYIEFWGEMNDGKPDRELYRNTDYQLNDKWSLQTDTATYFLTTDIDRSSKLRLKSVDNNVAGNTLPAEPYFMYTIGNYFRNMINLGNAVNVGQYIYSSSYDSGEGWSSGEFIGPTSFEFNDLKVYTGGPAAKLSIALSGNRMNPRRYLVKVNSDSILGKQMDYYNYSKDSAAVPLALLDKDKTNKAIINVENISGVTTDRMVIHQSELTYPRQFDFGGQKNFEFVLPASSSGNYLEIRGFNYGTVAPVLYDITNRKRYIGNITTPNLVRVALEPSLSARRLVLVNQEVSNITSITSLATRNFIDYSQLNNQGNYIIITNPLLVPSSGANPIEDYKQYRSSVAGGGHNVIVVMIDQLVDQFAFGIRKHPISVRNFLLFARQRFATTPKNVLLIGKGVNYVDQRYNERATDLDQLNLVPTFGYPASDQLLAADKGDAIPNIGVGRLSVVTPGEITDYLNKVKEFEAEQRTSSPLIKDKAWMKNVLHAVGSSEPTLQRILDYYMTEYKNIISDSLYGAKVYTLSKTSAESVQLMNGKFIDKLFADGMSLITYFGHSSTTTLEFNLNDPKYYDNKGKYPLFIALGCKVGDFYNYTPKRLTLKETLSEKFVLAPERGTIGFMAATHWGVPHYLDLYNTRAYKNLTSNDYGQTIGENMQATIRDMLAYTTQEDFFARAQCEQFTYHGDPALTLNPHAKPDYVIEEPLLKVEPSFVSVADRSFKLTARFLNIGKAVNADLDIEVKREYPDKTTEVIYRQTIRGTRYEDAISIDVPIDAIQDKGSNKLTITLDPENKIEELFETNNSVTKEIIIYTEEAKPVYPYNFSIINKQNIKFVASTANPFAPSRLYRFEIDSSATFSSPLKISKDQNAKGGIIEFEPQLTFKDNTVYYWRVAPVPLTGEIQWNTSSFIYLPNHELGYNQSDTAQHTTSITQRMALDEISKQWRFDSLYHLLQIKNRLVVSATPGSTGTLEAQVSIGFDNNPYTIASACRVSTIVFNLFEPNSLKPIINSNSNSLGSGSSGNCKPKTETNFEFLISDPTERKNAMAFMDKIPNGYFVVVRNIIRGGATGVYVADWKSDESLNGVGNTLYHKLKSVGFTDIDEYNRPRAFAFVYQKNNKGFTPVSGFSTADEELKFPNVSLETPDTLGYITSPVFGPAKSWRQLLWQGNSLETPGTDDVKIDIVGVRNNGNKAVLVSNIDLTQPTVDISAIDAKEYPFLQLEMRNADSINFSPYQLKYWRLTYEPSPEGAVTPNTLFNMKDTFEVGEPINFKLAFKNISDVSFSDSIKVKMLITDRNNITHTLDVARQKPVVSGDTLVLSQVILSKDLVGSNTLFVDINPYGDQPEEYHFNNFIFHNFYVKGDTLSPMMDVTFDNTHILNGDIVASKPKVQIRLKDEARWMLLDDNKLVTVQVKYPNEQTPRVFEYNSDTLRFSPSTNTQPSAENTAVIDFSPHFTDDGEYELIVSGKDKSENTAGNLEYRVKFNVINKPMISNMLNYPNPFTTSTAFVFTITGTEVPQNLKIQILTVTGKIVKEITKDELGPLRVGRNITEYKWDGTDQYGQKLGNGVYLYRVVTNLNGKALDKYKAADDKTDKYFNNGYGKMYLMR